MRALATWVLAVLGALVLLAADPSRALAERRVALVIGNSPYQHMVALQNPRNDANDMATALRDLGFEVMERPNVERKDVRELLKDFSRLLVGADTAVVYYAGHALEYRGQYYLVPIDAALEDADALKYDMLSVADLRDLLGKVSGLRMMIFDACRNDPLDKSAILSPEAARAMRRAELERALAGAQGGQGMVVAYATAPFDVAEDGKARNSPFTRALLKWIKEPELELRPLFQRVSREVYDETKGRQTPEISVALRGDYMLNRTQSHHSVWLRIHRSSDPLDFKDFIARFPLSEHRLQAERRLEMLERAARLAAERLEQQRLAARQRAICADEKAKVETAREDQDALRRLKAAAQCPEESGPAIDAALAAIAEREARERRAAQERREREQQLARQRAVCADELAQVARLKDDRAGLQRLKAAAQCPGESGPAIDAALSSLDEREARERKVAQEQAERRRAQCAVEVSQVERLKDDREALQRLRATAQCLDQSGPAIDTALAVIADREARARKAAEAQKAQEKAAQERAARDRAAQDKLAQDKAEAEKAERERVARHAVCADEVARVDALKDDRAGLQGLKAAARCPEESGPSVDAALAVLAEREARARQAAQEQAEREKAVHLAVCAEEAAQVEALKADRDGLQRLKAAARCPERSDPLVAAALSTIAAGEKQKAEQERLAALSERRRQEELCRAEADRIKAAAGAEDAEDRLADLRGDLKCPESALLFATAVSGAKVAARKVCTQEQQQLAALGSADLAALTAFARTARCTEAARTAQAQVDRLQAEQARMEEVCSHDQSELDRLRSLGNEGRNGLEQLQLSTACERLKPLVVAALGVPLPPPAPEINTAAQLRSAAGKLRQMGCLAGGDDDLPLAAVQRGLRKYFDVRKVQNVSLDVDEDLLKRLDGEGETRVCPLECGDGEELRRGKCVPERKRAPAREQTRPSRPATSQSRPRREPEARSAPPPARRAPPVASSTPARRSPTIILGN